MTNKKTEAMGLADYWGLFVTLFPGVIAFTVGFLITWYWDIVRDYVIWTVGYLAGLIMGVVYVLWKYDLNEKELFG